MTKLVNRLEKFEIKPKGNLGNHGNFVNQPRFRVAADQSKNVLTSQTEFKEEGDFLQDLPVRIPQATYWAEQIRLENQSLMQMVRTFGACHACASLSETTHWRHISHLDVFGSLTFDVGDYSPSWCMGITDIQFSSLKTRFSALKEKWKSETSFHSSLGEICTNDAYISIIGMGPSAIPFILKDLEESPRHWFYALEKIAGYDVAEGITKYSKAREAWLSWGREKNHI